MDDRDKKYGVIGTTIFHVLVLLLLIFFGFKTLPQEEEGILVNFGDTVLGQGEVEPRESQAPPQEQEKVTPPPPKQESLPESTESEPNVKEEVKTQDFEDAPVVVSEDQKKKEKEERERLDRERQEREEQERIEKEKEAERQKEIERQQKIEAEKEAQRQKELAEQRAREEAERKKQEEQDRKAAEARNRVSGAFSGKGNGDSTSEGDSGGTGNQGYVTGDPNSKNRSGSGLGNSGSGAHLQGRSLLGTLPKPQHNSNKEGIVVMKITVDRNGNVTSAEFQMKGSNTQDRELIQNAKAAALLAKFNADENASAYAQGTITYHFQLD
ncbi:cell envelope integrity protein TolA [Carboxylicivirga sp. M1479]|uniref:cell envelope integrity protein TolA n=1 Tax=Carboxylicivirga sp. M1479 TaxID=2594476 RepID=UPI0011774410|nr:cell envelope integrity protein TolA [Carboxylicivirga sp. M1479]TRX63000.1 cell envelope integrity protein TolA [Carboxylicivirga sp. M1479]